jgi:hypothetical protein
VAVYVSDGLRCDAVDDALIVVCDNNEFCRPHISIITKNFNSSKGN